MASAYEYWVFLNVHVTQSGGEFEAGFEAGTNSFSV